MICVGEVRFEFVGELCILLWWFVWVQLYLPVVVIVSLVVEAQLYCRTQYFDRRLPNDHCYNGMFLVCGTNYV